MPIPEELLTEICRLRRSPGDWFSIDEIKKRDRDLEIAARFVQTTTGTEVNIRRTSEELYKRLEDWAGRILAHEVRLCERKGWEVLSDNFFVPAPADEKILRDGMVCYINGASEQLKESIADFTKYTPEAWLQPWSKLDSVAEQLCAEISNTIPLAAEISRLEILDFEHVPVDKIGHSQIRIERFFTNNYAKISHPFDDSKQLKFSSVQLTAAIRLITYVVYRDVQESRLTGFRNKFISVFLRYLSCSRESSGAVIEQVSALLEPFLKKLSLLFSLPDANGKPVWHSSLDSLLPGLGLSTVNLKSADTAYWQAQKTEDGIFRLAYQLRHKGAHEAHDCAYYERERHAYYVFASILVSCHLLVESRAEIKKAIDFQEDVDEIRDLFVRIEELKFGPDGSRLSRGSAEPQTRLEKLLHLTSRAQTVWPNCSAALRSCLESEYLSVKDELNEADREADIQAYLEDMRPDDY